MEPRIQVLRITIENKTEVIRNPRKKSSKTEKLMKHNKIEFEEVIDQWHDA